METIASLAKSAAHAGRWCVNAALMAVGMPPLETPVVETALIRSGDRNEIQTLNEARSSRWAISEEPESQPLATHLAVDDFDDWGRPRVFEDGYNPSSGLPMISGSIDAGGFLLGESPDRHF